MGAAQEGLSKKVGADKKPLPNEYMPPSEHKFRDNEIPINKKDFVVSVIDAFMF
jgi:hypothetical protein